MKLTKRTCYWIIAFGAAYFVFNVVQMFLGDPSQKVRHAEHALGPLFVIFAFWQLSLRSP